VVQESPFEVPDLSPRIWPDHESTLFASREFLIDHFTPIPSDFRQQREFQVHSVSIRGRSKFMGHHLSLFYGTAVFQVSDFGFGVPAASPSQMSCLEEGGGSRAGLDFGVGRG